MSSCCPLGLCHPVKEKDEDGDMVSETMQINVVDEKKNIGEITIDSGAAENVLPRNYLRVDFEATNGVKSNILFQVTDSRKPLASVSKIVAKGNRVVFAPDRSYIENVHSGRRIDMQLVNGTYAIDVEQGAGCEAFTNDVADGDEPQGSEDAGQRHPTLVGDPQLPSQTEIDEHNMTHSPFRSWCRHCVRGRVESHPHHRQKPRN